MHQAIYERLIEVAKEQSYTTYSEIAPLAGLDMSIPEHREEIGELLIEIVHHEHRLGKPMLSVVVVHQHDNMPGPGFFRLAKELGLQKDEDNLTFFAHELIRVHNAWRE
jgi:hypothetical protein